MQFLTAVAVFATAVSAGVLPLGHGPVVSGGSCSADVSTTSHIPVKDCLKALSNLRARGDNDHVACDKMFRPTYKYITEGACTVVTEVTQGGNAHCMNPKIVADGLEEILGLCGSTRNTIVPGEYSFFQLNAKVKVVAA